MWILRRIDSAEDQTFWLLAGIQYSIGRKDCDITIEDRSVSRKHAEVEIQKPNPVNIKDLGYKPSISIRDVSKFGTIINGQKHIGASVEVHAGDKIVFGTNPALLYQLEWLPFIVCCSGVSVEENKIIKQHICDIGGHITQDLNISTHLLMPEIKFTSKLIVALAQAKPLISTAYLEAIKNRATCNMELPDVNSYLPSIVGEGLGQPSRYYPNPMRTSLFKDKTFLFLSQEQREKAGDIVLGASGKCVVSLGQEENSFYEAHRHSCIVSPKSMKDNPLLQEKVKKFKDMGINFVKEEEIGLAVVYCDAKKYCNPNGEVPSSQVAPKPPPALSRAASKSMDSQQHPTLVMDSQELGNPDKKVEVSKRVLVEDSQIEEPNKRPRLSEPAPIEPQTPVQNPSSKVSHQTPSPVSDMNISPTTKISPQDSEKSKRPPISSLFPNVKPKPAPNKLVIVVDDETTTDATETVTPPKLLKEEEKISPSVQRTSPMDSKPKTKTEVTETPIKSSKQQAFLSLFKPPENPVPKTNSNSNSNKGNINKATTNGINVGKENIENETENIFGKKVQKTVVVGDVDLKYKRPTEEMADENAEEKAEKLRIIESKLIAKDEEPKEKLPNFKKFRKAGTSSTSKVISVDGFGVFQEKTPAMQDWLAQAETELKKPVEKDDLFETGKVVKPKRKSGK